MLMPKQKALSHTICLGRDILHSPYNTLHRCPILLASILPQQYRQHETRVAQSDDGCVRRDSERSNPASAVICTATCLAVHKCLNDVDVQRGPRRREHIADYQRMAQGSTRPRLKVVSAARQLLDETNRNVHSHSLISSIPERCWSALSRQTLHQPDVQVDEDWGAQLLILVAR